MQVVRELFWGRDWFAWHIRRTNGIGSTEFQKAALLSIALLKEQCNLGFLGHCRTLLGPGAAQPEIRKSVWDYGVPAFYGLSASI